MACCFIQHHIVALALDIDIFKADLLSMWDPISEPTFREVALCQGSDFSPLPWNMAKRNFQ